MNTVLYPLNSGSDVLVIIHAEFKQSCCLSALILQQRMLLPLIAVIYNKTLAVFQQ